MRSPRSSALISPRAAKEMKDSKENNGSEGVLKGIKKPKDGSEGGSGGKMMGQMASKNGPEILQAGRGIRRGKNDNVERERINKIKVHKENNE